MYTSGCAGKEQITTETSNEDGDQTEISCFHVTLPSGFRVVDIEQNLVQAPIHCGEEVRRARAKINTTA